MKTPSRIIILLSGFTLLFFSACARIPTGPPNTPEARATPISSPTTAPYPVPLENAYPQPQTDPDQTVVLPIISGPPASLPANGPWMLVRADDTLSILGLDGSAPVVLTADPYIGPPNLSTTVSPTGDHVAFITAGDFQLHDLTLHIISLPEAKTQFSSRLTSPETEPGLNAAPGDPGFEIARAISSVNNLAWSPDGRRLAFSSALNGPNADLYIYNLDTAQVLRLSTEPGQEIVPSWSPDGQYLLYSGVDSLGTGAGYGMVGVWAAPHDGSASQALELPENSGDERHVGWFAPDTALRYTFNARCGFNNLRAVNILTGEARVFWANAFQAIGFDPISKKVLLSIAALDETCNPGSTQGLVLTHPEAQDALIVSEQNALEIAWSPEANKFLAATPEGVLAFDLFGRQTILPGAFDRIPTYAPAGDYYVWAQTDFQGIPGIWLGESATVPEQIYNGRAFFPIWDPTVPQLFFFNNEGLYKTDLANPPILISPNIVASDAVMILPVQ